MGAGIFGFFLCVFGKYTQYFQKNTQYFRKNTQYFRFSCQYVCLYGPPDDVKGMAEWMWTYGAKSNQQVRERWTC